ncbi:MAG: glutathione S-transferase C-terminal domain-containing protein [Solirubrobacteraceae bacterium]
MERLDGHIYADLQNAVYESGFARSQEAYEEAATRVFETLAWLEELLGTRRYLAGDRITASDWRLFPRWSASTRSTSTTSAATCGGSSTTRTCGATRGSSTSAPGSLGPSRWSRSSATTTRRTTRSSPAGSSRSARSSTGTRRTGGLKRKRRRDEPPEEPSCPSLESSGPSGRRASHLGGLALCGSCSASGRNLRCGPRIAQGPPHGHPATWADFTLGRRRASARRRWRPCRGRAAR